MKNLLCLCLSLLFAAPLPAADPDWQPVATELLKREKTGFGGLCGIVVDHQTGTLWANLSDRGMFRSNDQGQSWMHEPGDQPTGRTESPGCWALDPTGKTHRMVTALVYGAPISVSNNDAQSWKSLDKASAHIDWCAVDWTSPEFHFVLALKHEAHGLLLASSDGGKTFREAGTGYGSGWVFDEQTAVVAQVKSKEIPTPRLMRTTDQARTFQPCGDFNPAGVNSAQALPKWHAGALYWLTEEGLVSTSDKGLTWKKVGNPTEAQYGPIFGTEPGHCFVLSKRGVLESKDGGATWADPIAIPKGMNGLGGLSWLEFDPQHNTLYLMKMGSDLYRLAR